MKRFFGGGKIQAVEFGGRTFRRPLHAAFWTICGALVLLAFGAPILAAEPSPDDELLHFLDRSIDWYRSISDFDRSAGDPDQIVFRDTADDNARQVLKLSFDFGRAQAALLAANEKPDATATTTAGGRGGNLTVAAANAAQQVIQFQQQIDALDRDIANPAATSRPVLDARKAKLVAQLDLAKQRKQILTDYSKFLNTTNGGLQEKVEDLRRSVPEVADAPASSASTNAPDAAGSMSAAIASVANPLASITGATSGTPAPVKGNPEDSFHPASAGILGLVTEMITLSREISELNQLSAHTESLQQASDKLRGPLRTELQDANRRTDALATTRETDDVPTLTAQKQQLDAIAANLKLLAGAAVPLGEQSHLLDSSRSNFQEWHNLLERQYSMTLRYFLYRLIAMGVAIVVLLGISEIWRRATFRYVRDVRRRRQFLLLRRIIVGCIIVVILVAGVVTEFGSLATFAGLITAGIAVSLQTVILSGVAYFFFIGRYGLRVGDRVTVAGITGDVVDIGLFRLYLMELGGKSPDLHRTGRIVVFSNSVLFGGSAFFKQMPGADFGWHEVSMTLAPNSDIHLAESRFMDAVKSVYADYRQEIARQQEAVNAAMHLQLPAPEPEGRLRFVESGLELSIRYPVETHHGPETDDRITRALLQTIDNEPKLKLVPSSAPRIQAAG